MTPKKQETVPDFSKFLAKALPSEALQDTEGLQDIQVSSGLPSLRFLQKTSDALDPMKEGYDADARVNTFYVGGSLRKALNTANIAVILAAYVKYNKVSEYNPKTNLFEDRGIEAETANLSWIDNPLKPDSKGMRGRKIISEGSVVIQELKPEVRAAFVLCLDGEDGPEYHPVIMYINGASRPKQFDTLLRKIKLTNTAIYNNVWLFNGSPYAGEKGSSYDFNFSLLGPASDEGIAKAKELRTEILADFAALVQPKDAPAAALPAAAPAEVVAETREQLTLPFAASNRFDLYNDEN